MEQQLDAARRNEDLLAEGAGQDGLGADAVGGGGYFDGYGGMVDRGGSFRLGYGDKRRSWLGLGGTPGVSGPGSPSGGGYDDEGMQFMKQGGGGRCC